MTVGQLNIGEEALIEHVEDGHVHLKLLDMGCIPGEKIRVEFVAPFGGPIAVSVSGYILSMRRKEAGAIKVKKL